MAIARAMATRCDSPPESDGGERAAPVRHAEPLEEREGALLERRGPRALGHLDLRDHHVLERGHVREEVVLLKDEPGRAAARPRPAEPRRRAKRRPRGPRRRRWPRGPRCTGGACSCRCPTRRAGRRPSPPRPRAIRRRAPSARRAAFSRALRPTSLPPTLLRSAARGGRGGRTWRSRALRRALRGGASCGCRRR